MNIFIRLVFVIWILTIVGMAARSQTPAQFSGLLTTSTDYTCGGTVPCATWPMPPIPAPGGSYVDPTWGTTTYRLAVPPANTTGQAYSTYSRVQAWNKDNSRMFLSEPSGPGYLNVYDSTSTPPTPINHILTDVGIVNSGSLDALWAYTDPNRIYYIPGKSSGHGLELRYVDVSGCTSTNCTLKSYLVHTFSCVSDALTGDILAGTQGNQIETGSGAQGGMSDKTDRYFSFTCDYVDGAGRHEIDFIRYDRQTDSVTHQDKWYKACPGQVPTGCAVWSKTGLRHNLIRMNQHPDSRFITVIWQCGSRDATWTRGCGTEVFDPSYNFIGLAFAGNVHQDVGFDVNGVPVAVQVGSARNDIKDERAIAIADLTKLSSTGVTYKRILLPCNYSRQTGCDAGTFLGAKSGASHISMTGSWGSLPGYGLFSTMMLAGPYRGNAADYPVGTTLGTTVSGPGTVTVTPGSMSQIAMGVVSTIDTGPNMETVTWTAATPTTASATFAKAHAGTAAVNCLSCGDTGFGAMENLAVKIDTTAPDNSPAVFYRIGRTMAIRDNDYNAEPHTAVNRDFTQITWGSTWNTEPTNSLSPVYGFWSKLSSSGTGPHALSTSAAGTGSGTITGCAGSYASGASYSCMVTANNGSTLTGVSGCGGSGTTTYSGTMPAANCTVTATFDSTAVSVGVRLGGIMMTPSTASTAAGKTQQFTATCTIVTTGLSNVNSASSDCTNSVTWSSSNPAAATITPGALASGVAAGSTTITATLFNITASSVLTVTGPSLTGITVTPATASIVAGIGTQQYAARCSYSNGTNSDCTSTVSWSSSNVAAATIKTGAMSSLVASGVKAGSTTIKATSGSITGSSALTVTFGSKPATMKTGAWVWIGGGSMATGTSKSQAQPFTTLGTPSDGSAPGAREAFVSWTDRAGNLWLFGGGFDSPGAVGYLNDLWEFLPSDQKWVSIDGSRTVPAANEVRPGVYGALGTPAAGLSPGGREASASWTDKSGNLWLFGGIGYDAAGRNGSLNDLWKFDPSTQEWAWIKGDSSIPAAKGLPGVYGQLGVSAAGNIPGARWGASSWTDLNGNLWLFGGEGYDSAGSLGLLNDLWELDPSAGKWVWMAGSNTVGSGGKADTHGSFGTPSATNVPSARNQAVSWVDSTGNLWLFGGESYDSNGILGYLNNDLWEFNPSTRKWAWMGGDDKTGCSGCGVSGVYGTLGEADPANSPGSRFQAFGWTDGNGNLWLFGGSGYDSTGTHGILNDLWEFSPSTMAWAWMGGSSTVPGAHNGQPGLYGTMGVPSAGTAPGSRWGTGGWTDSNGNLWIFGGEGHDSSGDYGNLNDLWVYQPSSGSLPAAVPTISIANGTNNATATVIITEVTPGATIYYTTDGRTPSTASNVYTGPITVSSTTTIEAIASVKGYGVSAEAAATYSVGQSAAE